VLAAAKRIPLGTLILASPKFSRERSIGAGRQVVTPCLEANKEVIDA